MLYTKPIGKGHVYLLVQFSFGGSIHTKTQNRVPFLTEPRLKKTNWFRTFGFVYNPTLKWLFGFRLEMKKDAVHNLFF